MVFNFFMFNDIPEYETTKLSYYQLIRMILFIISFAI